ncbi:MAG: helix-turn-helix domain-containing protein [Deltaproteobacteria bacterium]|nr:helix-turn-helix domain-containing protein [Deltaproteobacteria bacterium]
MLGIKKITIYHMVHHKRIPHIKLTGKMLRFSRKKIEEWIAANSVEPRKRDVSMKRRGRRKKSTNGLSIDALVDSAISEAIKN